MGMSFGGGGEKFTPSPVNEKWIADTIGGAGAGGLTGNPTPFGSPAGPAAFNWDSRPLGGSRYGVYATPTIYDTINFLNLFQDSVTSYADFTTSNELTISNSLSASGDFMVGPRFRARVGGNFNQIADFDFSFYISGFSQDVFDTQIDASGVFRQYTHFKEIQYDVEYRFSPAPVVPALYLRYPYGGFFKYYRTFPEFYTPAIFPINGSTSVNMGAAISVGNSLDLELEMYLWNFNRSSLDNFTKIQY